MNPLSYGYIRVTDELDDDELRQLEQGIRKLAEAEDLRLIEIWYEYQSGHYGTFYDLVAEMQRTHVRCVLMPSLAHLSPHPLRRDQLLTRLTEAKAAELVRVTHAERAALTMYEVLRE